MSYNSRSNRARNFKSASRFALVRFWNYSRDYSLNCTPLRPITITYYYYYYYYKYLCINTCVILCEFLNKVCIIILLLLLSSLLFLIYIELFKSFLKIVQWIFEISARDVITADYIIIMSRTLNVTGNHVNFCALYIASCHFHFCSFNV